MLKKTMVFLLMITLFTVSGCTQSPLGFGNQPDKQPLRVAAAADLIKAFRIIGDRFENKTGVPVEFSFGSTGTLAMQIENGAPFDVFAAANIAFIDTLKEKGLIIADTQQLYAQGRIGIATMRDSGFDVNELRDLAFNPEIKKVAIANPDHAPYGTAAQEALEYSGLLEAVKPKLVYGNNISDTLAILQSGNVEAAIIALSIAERDEVNFALIDASKHRPLKQSMAVIMSTRREQAARQFLEYVNSSEGRKVMLKYGFLLPGDDF